MKKIIINNCSDCPYSDVTLKYYGKSIYRCDHYDIESEEWVEQNELWKGCPLEEN